MNVYEVQKCMFNTTEIRLVEKKVVILNSGGTSTLGWGINTIYYNFNCEFSFLGAGQVDEFCLPHLNRNERRSASPVDLSATGNWTLLVHIEMCCLSKEETV